MLCFILVVYHNIINDTSETLQSHKCFIHPAVVMLGYWSDAIRRPEEIEMSKGSDESGEVLALYV